MVTLPRTSNTSSNICQDVTNPWSAPLSPWASQLSCSLPFPVLQAPVLKVPTLVEHGAMLFPVRGKWGPSNPQGLDTGKLLKGELMNRGMKKYGNIDYIMFRPSSNSQ